MTDADAIGVALDCVLLACLGVSLYTDLVRAKVYDWCTLTAAGAGLVLRYAAGALGPAQGNAIVRALGGPLIDGLTAVAVALAIFGLAHLLGMLGGGDVKLLVAVAALKGLEFFLVAAILTACAGAVIAVGVLIWRGRLREGLKSSLMALFTPRKFKRRREAMPEDAAELTTIPYVAAIVVGTVAAWLLSTGTQAPV
jgi:prepilin peptidase CpaA